MKQTARIISTYSADVFGVCSALFELGGMTIMHDPSGCNSTYTTHDEPRWFDMDSMVYISGLTEMEAIMGDDQKLIGDIVSAARELNPKFIAIAGTPIPTMTGFDFDAVAAVVEEETGIPALGFATTGMGSYVTGVSMALEAVVRRFVRRDVVKTPQPSANILGLTPLDFSIVGEDRSIARFLEEAGFAVNARFAMGADLEELSRAGEAHVNLVVSAGGLRAAQALQELFGTPYVVGLPVAGPFAQKVKEALTAAAATGENQLCHCSDLTGGDVVVVGEGVRSLSLAQAMELETGLPARAVCAVECESGVLREKDVVAIDEEDIIAQLQDARIVVADPLYRPICPDHAKFVALPHEAFSGRIYREDIPDLTADFSVIGNEVL